MTIQEFFDKYNGKGLDTDGAYGNQCMDLMHKYCVDVLGLSLSALAAPAAKDVYLNFDSITGKENFEKIPNTPTGVPQKGDIVLWGTGVGPYGHVAVFKDGDTHSFNSFDQNWNGHPYCETVNHSYNGVLGWLHPKNLPQDQQPVIDELRSQRDSNWNLYQDELKKNTELTQKITDLEGKVNSVQSESNDKTKAIATLNTKIDLLTEAMGKDAVNDHDLAVKLAAYEKEEIEDDFFLDRLCKLLGVSNTNLTEQDKQSLIESEIKKLKTPHDELVKQVEKNYFPLIEAGVRKYVAKNKPFIDTLKQFFHL